MRAINLASTPICELCSSPAAYNRRLCVGCARMFGKLCERCARTASCPDCAGELVDPIKMFPLSLFVAIDAGQVEEVRSLIVQNKPALGKLRDSSGLTPLHVAVRSKTNTTETCEALLKAEASPLDRDAHSSTPLMVAVVLRKWTKKLLGLLSPSIDDQDDHGRTALMFAAKGGSGFGAEKGNVAIAEALLVLGATACIFDKYGNTALAYAEDKNATGQNDRMVALLKEAIIAETARKDFDRRYTYSFDKNGVLHTSPKARTQ
jgi:ankyrin repeat protein